MSYSGKWCSRRGYWTCSRGHLKPSRSLLLVLLGLPFPPSSRVELALTSVLLTNVLYSPVQSMLSQELPTALLSPDCEVTEGGWGRYRNPV
jgi:hypothetical protein